MRVLLSAYDSGGTSPVYAGFGSMLAPKDIARVAIEAIRAQGRRALVSPGWAALALIDDRDDCFAVGKVNQQALFGRVAAVVHHGGAGTTTTAARAGAPQVVVPPWAGPALPGRVAGPGIGTAHHGPAPATESLSAALRTALAPQTRARARTVAGTIRTDEATVAATLLLDTGSRERPPASVNRTGSSSQDPEHENLQTLATGTGRPPGPRQAERCSSCPPGSSRRPGRLATPIVASDLRSELMT